MEIKIDNCEYQTAVGEVERILEETGCVDGSQESEDSMSAYCIVDAVLEAIGVQF